MDEYRAVSELLSMLERCLVATEAVCCIGPGICVLEGIMVIVLPAAPSLCSTTARV